jgi:hypothetical protein
MNHSVGVSWGRRRCNGYGESMKGDEVHGIRGKEGKANNQHLHRILIQSRRASSLGSPTASTNGRSSYANSPLATFESDMVANGHQDRA